MVSWRFTICVSSIQLRLGDMDKESKDNITQIVNLQETINIQAERVNAVDADRQKAAEKAKADLESTVASNAKAIADLRNELGQSIVDKFRPAEDRLANIDGDIQGLNKTVAVFEQKHTETAEKIQEVTVLTSNIQVQVKAQEQKMVEQSANDMNQIREQLKDVENQAGVSGQKIKELDAGHQTLVEKISGMENGVADRLDDLAKADASLLAKLSALESTNDQTVRAATADLEKKIHDAEHRLDQSSKAEIQSVGQHLEEQMRTNNSNTERRLAEADAGSQQLLEKLLEVEKDVEGKVRDNASSVQNQLINLDAENKNNSQCLSPSRSPSTFRCRKPRRSMPRGRGLRPRQRKTWTQMLQPMPGPLPTSRINSARPSLRGSSQPRTDSARSTVISRPCTGPSNSLKMPSTRGSTLMSCSELKIWRRTTRRPLVTSRLRLATPSARG